MALTIKESPYLFGWARNRARLKLLCNGIQQSSGSHANFKFYFTDVTGTNSRVVLAIDGRELVYTIGSGTDQYSASNLATLLTKMAANHYVNEVFTATADTTNRTLQLYGTEVGKHTVEIYTTTADGVRDGGERSMITAISPNYKGLDKKNKDNYAVASMVEVTVNDYNALKTYKTDQMVFHPDADNLVSVPMDVLSGYIPQPDLPTGTNSPWQLLTNALMKYRIRYGEMWGSDSPLVQSMSWTGYFYALCGEMTERYAAVNLPDWKSGQVYGTGTDNNLFWVIGQDTGEVQYVRQSQPEWIYGLFYRSGIAVGTPVGSSYRVTVAMTGKKKDGSTVNISNTYTQVNGQVYRLDVRPSRLASSDLLWYTVTISTSWGSWTRTYHVLPDMYEQNYLLLQDKYGLLRVAVCGRLNREVATEGDEMVIDRRRYLDVAKHETYTAIIDGLTKEEAARIGRCVGNDYHYIQNQLRWERVTIEPGSFAVRDSEQNLLSVELQLRFVEDQQENMATGTMERAVGLVLEDENAVVSFDVITDPIANKIF